MYPTLNYLRKRVDKLLWMYAHGKINQDLDFEFIDLNKIIRSNNDWVFDSVHMNKLINDNNKVLIYPENKDLYAKRFNKCQYVYYARDVGTLVYYGGNIPGITATINALINFSYNKLEYEFMKKLKSMNVKFIKEYNTPCNKGRHVDFYLPHYKLIIEIDSRMHVDEIDESLKTLYVDNGYAICNLYKEDFDSINTLDDIIDRSLHKDPIIYTHRWRY